VLVLIQVETIGDAYMVVGGVPEVSAEHAQKVANFALDMVKKAYEVKSPATGKPIQVRHRHSPLQSGKHSAHHVALISTAASLSSCRYE